MRAAASAGFRAVSRAVGRLPVRRVRGLLAASDVPIWEPRRLASTPEALRFGLAPAGLPPGRRIYAVGDVHGARRSLEAMHVAIAADLDQRPIGSALLVYLGDLIGPGPDSAGVIAAVASGPCVPGAPGLALRGDREQMLLDALDGDRAAATDLLHAGGEAVLASWGIAPGTPRELWSTLVPKPHVAFLRSLPPTHREGGYLFVHAGVRPGIPLAHQAEADLRGIRQPFLSYEARLGAVVVHGHSVTPEPVLRPNRIGLDTGAGIGGRLTCAVLEQERIAFLSPEPDGKG